jgi:hypothetical protein
MQGLQISFRGVPDKRSTSHTDYRNVNYIITRYISVCCIKIHIIVLLFEFDILYTIEPQKKHVTKRKERRRRRNMIVGG